MRPGDPRNPEAPATALPLAEIREGIHAIRAGGHHQGRPRLGHSRFHPRDHRQARRTRPEALQQGPAHHQNGDLRRRALSQRQIYFYGQ